MKSNKFQIILMIILLPMIGKAQMFDCGRSGGGYFKVIAESGLNIREEPNLTSNKLGKIPNGAMVFCCQYCENCNEEAIEGKEGIWKKVFLDEYVEGRPLMTSDHQQPTYLYMMTTNDTPHIFQQE